jgi:hypothetical protein
MMTLKVHPAANMLPLLSENEFQELKADIAARGLREPIEVKNDFIIDGRHRYRACRDLDIEPTVQEYDGDPEDLIAEIVSRNILRRHLTADQRAELVVKMCGDRLRAEAKARVKAHQFGAKPTAALKPAQPRTRGRTAERIAAMAKVGRDTARRALRTHKDGAAPKAKVKPDKTDPNVVIKRFQRWMAWYTHGEQRKVRPVIHEFTAP